MRAMGTSVLDETTTSGIPATARPYFAGGLAALSVGAAAIHFAVNPATWHDQYTSQMLHVWVVPYPGGPFSDDLSRAATDAAVRAVFSRG
jgi:hypothetical protein